MLTTDCIQENYCS